MTPEELLRDVARRFDSAGIPYMVTGSFASSMLELPRTTRDLDVVVEVQGAAIDREYLERWALVLGVADLLERILPERNPRS